MRHLSSENENTQLAYQAGDTLIWRLPPGTASIIASEMSEVANAHALGDSEICLYGLNLDGFYFDLRLSRNVSAVEIKLMFGRSPMVY